MDLHVIPYLVAIIVLLSIDVINGIALTSITIYQRSIYMGGFSSIAKSVQELGVKVDRNNENIVATHKSWTSLIEELRKIID